MIFFRALTRPLREWQIVELGLSAEKFTQADSATQFFSPTVDWKRNTNKTCCFLGFLRNNIFSSQTKKAILSYVDQVWAIFTPLEPVTGQEKFL